MAAKIVSPRLVVHFLPKAQTTILFIAAATRYRPNNQTHKYLGRPNQLHTKGYTQEVHGYFFF